MRLKIVFTAAAAALFVSAAGYAQTSGRVSGSDAARDAGASSGTTASGSDRRTTDRNRDAKSPAGDSSTSDKKKSTPGTPGTSSSSSSSEDWESNMDASPAAIRGASAPGKGGSTP